jgi:hypothetical protein
MEIIFVESIELKILATKLKDFYYLHLGHVDLDCIYFAEKVGDLPKKINTIELLGVNNPSVRQLLKDDKNYALTVWKDKWDELHLNTQLWLLFECLYSIEAGNKGKIRKPDIVEHAPIIDFFANSEIGIYWRKNDGLLPNLLDTHPLPIPLPPDEEEESAGSTL